MAGSNAVPAEYLTQHRRHRRIAYQVEMRRPFKHSRDSDIIEGQYGDPEGEPIGRLLMAEGSGERAFLVLPNEDVPLIHVEATLEADHRVASYTQVVGLLFDPAETPAPGIVETGERWEAGDLVMYVFDTDDDALAAQVRTP